MPCFIKLIRELGVTDPVGASLLDDYERLEELLKRRLNVDTHEEIHEVMKKMYAENPDALRELVEKVVEDIRKEKARAFPDRLKRQREMMKTLIAR
jgi:predicted house-cleaning noncanonical NTP pyrophosphatase (MazG superfamily)